ncbi:hypothetical protein [Myroides injenensis]|uniref:hypothetical protein n=1 Tax=Myroides injenensis TaxID=1183151 RepID=UPI00226F2A99|nr:hypothetical protein [Myroides injenensis]
MRKLLLILPALLIIGSCQNKKQMKLTRAAYTVEEGVEDHSPIYIEFDKNGSEPHLLEGSRIGGTNYIFNIDRELNLLKVAEIVTKVKDHKYREGNLHTDEKGVYYSYADTLTKHMSVFPFKEIDFGFNRPGTKENLLYLNASRDFFFEDEQVKREDLVDKLQDRDSIQLAFSKSLDFENYLQTRILLKELEISDKFLNKDLVY